MRQKANRLKSKLLPALSWTRSDDYVEEFNQIAELVMWNGEYLEEYGLWSSCGDILSKEEACIKALADYFDTYYTNDLCTGYYDPEEDRRDGNVDEFIGNYYLRLNS